jgi:tetratricopeptide (TPR) repeat protein
VVDFLINDLIGAASPSRAQGKIPTVDQVLARADQNIANKFAGRPLIEAAIRHALAGAYEELGRYPKAEQHAARAVELRLAHLGPEHADTIAAQNALGLALWQQYSHGEGQTLMTQVLTTARKVLGPEHPETLQSMHILAHLLYGLNHYDEAQGLHEQLLAIQKQVLGPEHPSTLATMHNLARDWQIMGNVEQAMLLHEQALAVELRGELIRDETLLMMMHLADIYSALRQFDRALDLRRRAMDGCVRVLGLGHHRTKTAIGTYFTSARTDRVHCEQARKDLEPLLDRSRRELAPEAKLTFSVTAICLALLLREQGRFAEARPLLEETRTEALRLRKENPKLLDGLTGIDPLRGLAEFLLGRWPGLAPGIRPAERPPASFTIEAPFRAVSPVADGRISPGEYGPPFQATFDDDTNPGRLQAGLKSRSKTPDDLSVLVHAAHTDRSLFLAFLVRDQVVDAGEQDAKHPFFNDSVDVFINGDNVANDVTPGLFVVGATGNREGFQLVADAVGHQYTVGEALTSADWKVGTSRTPDGYIIEFEIPLALIDTRDGPEFAPATSGSELMVNFGITDNDDPQYSGQMDYAIFWAEDPELAPFMGGEDFWTVSLRLVPKPTKP